MALTAKERENIIEEETLRFETRQNLHRAACGQHRRHRWFWWVGAVVIAVALWCHFSCGEGGSCHHGFGMGGPAGKHCLYHGDGATDGVEPGQPIPQAPAKK